LTEDSDTITYRLSEDDAAELEDIAWDNRTTKSHILRRVTREIIENDELREQILEDARGKSQTNTDQEDEP